MSQIYLDTNKDVLFKKANQIILNVLQQQYGSAASNVELRKLAATFRKNETIAEALANL
jgi:uncharacterized protein YggU (UPF0235/DUF167 family)